MVMLLMVACFASSVSMRMCDPLLPRLAEVFDVSLGSAAGVITGFALAYGLLQLVIGPLADRLGKLLVIQAAVVLAALAALACAIAPDLSSLVAARVVAGGVAGAIIPVAMAWVGDNVDYDERQQTLARLMSGGLLGLICGQLISGALADTLGWRWAFVMLAGLFGVVAVLMRRHPGARAEMRETWHQPRPSGAASMGGPRALWQGYREIAGPVWTRVILFAALLEALLMYGALSFIPTALYQRFGLPLWQAAMASAVVGLGGFAYSLLARRLIARLGERGLALAGGACVALGLLGVAYGPALWVVAMGSLALGLGFYAFHNTLQVHGTQLSAQRRSMGMALFALFLFLGQSVGVAMAAWVVAHAGFSNTFAGVAMAFAVLTLCFVRALSNHDHQFRTNST